MNLQYITSAKHMTFSLKLAAILDCVQREMKRVMGRKHGCRNNLYDYNNKKYN
jgi:hypothetical protein